MDTPDLSAFGKFVPGFEFLQNLTRPAGGGAAAGVSGGMPGMPPLSHWVAPTFDVEELEKRIQDLRAVHFWLDQNAKALGATIQALEVQKMTLATLKGMNVSLQEVAESFKMPVPPPAPASQEAPAAQAPQASAKPAAKAAPASEDASKTESSPAVDPMNWWNALTQQFQAIASTAMQDMAEHANRAAEEVKQAVNSAVTVGDGPAKTTGKAKAKAPPASKRAAPKTTAATKAATQPAAKKATVKKPAVKKPATRSAR
jgi:pyruvate/2-oxoglutarate dehydrogenase complex dihydrolipoamide acyltransferase (E2) component